MNPDRYAVGWQPSYSLIDVSVLEEDHDRMLKIEVHVLQWKSPPEQYRPLLTSQGDPVFRHRIPILGRDVPVAVTMPETAPNTADKATAAVEAAMSDEGTRNLVFRFWSLTVSQRREIALLLGLIDETELELPEPERYGRALLRASERGVLDQVAHEVVQRETQ